MRFTWKVENGRIIVTDELGDVVIDVSLESAVAVLLERFLGPGNWKVIPIK